MLEKYLQASRRGGVVLILVSALVGGAAASAQSPTTLVNFANSPDGANPYASLLADAKGDLFGTTYSGGVHGAGTVFEIVKDQTSGTYASTATILYSFTGGADGAHPYAGLIDANGNLFGTTY